MITSYVGLEDRWNGYTPLTTKGNSTSGYNLLDAVAISGRDGDYIPDVLCLKITKPGWWQKIITDLGNWISGSTLRLVLNTGNVSTYAPEIKLYAKAYLNYITGLPEITGYSMFAHFKDEVPIWECIFSVGNCTANDYRNNVPVVFSYQITSWNTAPSTTNVFGGVFLRAVDDTATAFIGFFGDIATNQLGYRLNDYDITVWYGNIDYRKSFDLGYKIVEAYEIWRDQYYYLAQFHSWQLLTNGKVSDIEGQIETITGQISELTRKIDGIIGNISNAFVSR